jgi:hypothetical protein
LDAGDFERALGLVKQPACGFGAKRPHTQSAEPDERQSCCLVRRSRILLRSFVDALAATGRDARGDQLLRYQIAQRHVGTPGGF